MSWKRYQNELIALLAVVLMFGAYFYKYTQVNNQTQQTQGLQQSLEELKEVVALKKVWADKKISKKIIQLQNMIPASKGTWSKKGKKVTASYKELNASELNNLTTKILNLPVQIGKLDIQKTGATYTMEFQCKW